MKKILAIACGAAGISAGGLALYFVLKKRKKKTENKPAEKTEQPKAEEPMSVISDPSRIRNEEIIYTNNYRSKTAAPVQKPVSVPVADTVSDKARIISPEDFGDISYRQIYLTYYADGVLADIDRHKYTAKDISEYLVPDFMLHFGQCENEEKPGFYLNTEEPDVVYIRNDRTKTEYSIERDTDPFTEE